MAPVGGGGFGGQGSVSMNERDQLAAEVDEVDRRTAVAKERGDFQALLELMESSLFLRRRLYGEGSEQVFLACRQLCEVCNYCATTMLQQGNLKSALDLLRRAEKVSERSDLDRAITYNNMACYYRRIGKLRTALSFLEKALAIEERTAEADVAQTHLNLCATLSQLQRHDRALFHAQCALVRIFEILSPAMLAGELSKPPKTDQDSAEGGVDPVLSERISVLCIAYHNLAVEHEYLKSFRAAMTNYREGLKWAGRFLGEEHQIFSILKHSMLSVSKVLNNPLGKRGGAGGDGGGMGGGGGQRSSFGGPGAIQQMQRPSNQVPPQLEQLLSSTPRDAPPPPQQQQQTAPGGAAGAAIQQELFEEIVHPDSHKSPGAAGAAIQHELFEEIVHPESLTSPDEYEEEQFESP